MPKVFRQSIDLATLEAKVMKMLLNDNNPILKILYQQYLASSIQSRELTGVGFFTKFIITDNVQRIHNQPSFAFGDIIAQVDGLKHGASFVLFITKGAIDMLEGYTYNEPWPRVITNLHLSYIKDKRDLPPILK